MSQTEGGLRQHPRLLYYARRYRAGWFTIAIAMACGSLVAVALPWPMKVVVDFVLGNERPSGPIATLISILPGTSSRFGLAIWAAAAGLGLFVLNAVIDVVLTCSWVRFGQRTVYDLAGDLFAAIQRKPLAFHTRSSVGDLLSRITGDSWAIYTLLDSLLFNSAHAIVTAALMAAVMFSMDARLALLAFSVAPLMAIASIVSALRVRNLAEQKRVIQSQLHSHVQQTLQGMPVVQAFSQEQQHEKQFERYTNSALQTQRRTAILEHLVGFVSGALTTLGTGAVLWLGAHSVLSGKLLLGDLLMFLAYLRPLHNAFRGLATSYTAAQSARVMMRRVSDVMYSDGEVRDRPGANSLERVRGEVQLEHVSFGYDRQRPVIRDVSLGVQPGQTLAIVGSTGAGKTTLVSLIPRFFDPWQGRVLVDGQDVRVVKLRDLRENVSVMLQEAFLFPVSVAQNIAYGRLTATQAEIEQAARASNAHDFIAALPEGYDTIIGERGATLSGGERQRIAIARALLKDAPILILDEPTSALDAQTESLLLEALKRLMKGRTTLIIAHRLSTIRDAGQIVVMEHGSVIESGTHDDLLAADGAYARLHRLQRSRPDRPAGQLLEVP